MNKVYSPLLICSCFLFLNSYAQTTKNGKGGSSSTTQGGTNQKKFKTKWKTNPFDNHVFIENNGQFDGKVNTGEKILYGVQEGDMQIYFTENKVVYRYDKIYYKDSKDASEDKDDIKNYRHEIRFLSSEWKGANKSVSIIAKNELNNYYTYSAGSNKGLKANIFKEIIYKDLYPGIDARYQFEEGKDGIKYSLIVHPGADLSKIKIDYSGAHKISKNAAGDIIINSPVDELTEHAPVSYYEGDESGNIPVSNIITGNTESFTANAEYDKSKTLIIDPWITDPLFYSGTWDRAYDLDWDYYGNVYAYGGKTSNLQLVKMNSSGVIQWTYIATPISGTYYGDFCTDKTTGTSYLVQGFSGGIALKVNTNGMLTGTFPGNPTKIDELWRAEFDACNGDIVVACGGTQGNYQAGVLDSNMTSANPVNILGASGPFHDMALLAIDPNGTQCYIASARSYVYDPTHFDNVVMQLPLPSLSPTAYEVHENSHFIEVSSVLYAGGSSAGNAYMNGFNGAAVSPSWLYLYNGDTIRRLNKNTGAFSSQYSIRTSTSAFDFGGIDVDACDNLFVGVADSIYVLDSTYNLVATVQLQDTVYDVHLGENGALYACGRGYVTQILEPISVRLISSTAGSPTSCSACNGRATVNVNCGIAPYSFLWSDGSTNESDTGLCAGIYTVTVKDGACPPHSDTAIVNISGKNGYTASVVDTNPDCALSLGNITVYPTGGTSPYTYSWSNGETTQKDIGLSAGTYICTITDSDGCKYDVAVTLKNPVTPTITVVPANDSICKGSNLSITASGVKTYSWAPNTGLSCYTCANPIATPTATTTYTVSGLDSNGCNAIATATIKVIPVPIPIVKGKDSICLGYQDTLTVTGGSTYLWSNSSTATSLIVSPATTKTITVTAYNGNGLCQHDTAFTITVVPTPTAVISHNKDTVCQGDSIQLNGSGGATYKWSNGSTSSSIWVKPDSATTYYLKAYSGTCNDSTKTEVYITPKITAAASIIDSVICPFDTAYLAVTSSGGPATYKWSTSSTSSAIMVTPGVTTTYTVTAYGACDSLKFTKTVTVIPLPVPIITGTSTKCAGAKDTLTVSGGTTYLWNNGSTKTTYNTGDINKDSTIYVTVKNSLGCAVKDSFKITAKPYPTGNLTYPSPCLNYPTTITAHPGGSGPFTYKWNTGGTNDTINITVTDTMNYTCVISNGCPITKNITVIPDAPTMFACCNTTIIIGNDTTITASGVNTYSWTPTTGLNCDTCSTVIATPTVTTTYTVTGTDAQGCTVERVVTITVETPCFNFTVPNVFTPNDGGTLGLNKVFYIKTENLTNWAITIYDRWGKEMFKTSNPLDYWVGTTEGGGNAPDGVYYYIISATCQGNTYKKDGFVQLIR